MLKGCIQVNSRPNINNTINMVPVDHVARLVAATAFNPPRPAPGVSHLTSHPRLSFNEYLSTLEAYGYEAPIVDYGKWRDAVESYVSSTQDEGREDHAL